ncbi:MAG TPA: DUF6504 family protein [Allosphingosinicella sp.]|jgi:protein ImuB
MRYCSCPDVPGFRPGARWARGEAPRPLPQPASGHPLVTALKDGNRLIAAAASPEAQALGLAPGMAIAQARILVPGLDVRDADPAGDAAFLARLGLFAVRRWTPRAAVSGADGLWLDLSGVSHLFGGEAAMGRRILAFCARLGVSARIAVAGTLGAAHALARFGVERIVLCPPGGESEAIAAMPLAALRLDAAALGTARRLGLETIGEAMAMPRAPLQRRFGPALLIRLDQALGRAPEPLDPIVPEEPPSAELRLLEPIATAEAIAEVIGEATARLVAELEQAGFGARRLALACERVDGDEQVVRIGTARATRDGGHLRSLFAARIETIDPGFGIERVRLTATRVEPLGAQPIGGSLAGEAPAPDLVPLVDRLAGRLGPRRLYRLSAVESDVPERSVRRIRPLDRPSAWPRWPRPVRLLSPPERIDGVVALLPDLPPRRFTWRGRAYRVRRADGPERLYGEWWKRSAETDAVRDYFQVEEEGGQRFWLYRRGDGVDARTGDLSWYLHGVFG